jgi:hypothetical protein
VDPQSLIADNRAAMDEFITVLSAVPERDWTKPSGEGRWSPAHHGMHIALAFEAFVRDARGGTPARLLGTPLKRRMWRLVGLSQVMWLARLPGGVKAPREVRPPDVPADRATVLDDLRARLRDFEAAANEVAVSGRRLTHPYFGAISLREAMVLCAVHTRHHAALVRRMSS